jgi:outer membrane protein assembly factor BamB
MKNTAAKWLILILSASALAGSSLVLGSVQPVATDDWPIFRGNPLQTGVATARLPNPLAVRWSFKTKDSIEGTAAIAKGTVYFGSLDENLYALDLATGKEKWHFKAGPIKVATSVRDGLVFVGNMDGIFYCLAADTGQVRWKFNTETEITSSASFARDTVLFGCGDENLYCLGLDGKERWKFKVAGGPVMASPAVAGDRTFVSGCDSSLHVLDLGTGKDVRDPVQLEGQTGAAAAVMADHLYVGTMTNQVLAINWKKGEVTWRFEPTRHAQPFFASAAVTEPLVITASRDKTVHALDRRDGKEIWQYTTEGKIDSSPVVAGGRVYVGSYDGNLYVLDLARGTLIQKLTLGKAILASCAVAGDCLVIGTDDGVLYCLGAKP